MSTAQSHIMVAQSRTYRWTREEYYRMGEIGLFENNRVELIEGEITLMSPISTLAREVLREIFDNKAGIQDYWILNIEDRQLEVYRRPIDDPTAEFGFSYGDKMIFREADSIAPLVKPEVSIAVGDLLPQRIFPGGNYVDSAINFL